MITTAGAPVHQGRQQGEARRLLVQAAVGRVRERYSRLGWLLTLQGVRWDAGRKLACFLPQQHERLQGIARGARVSQAALELIETLYRVTGRGVCKAATLDACFEIPDELEPLLTLRHSLPGSGGFASVELACAPWASCLAGVNNEGIGVLCLEDKGLDQPSLRLLAQDVLVRARAFSPAIDHLRRRAKYAGGTGTLLVADAAGNSARLTLLAGGVDVDESVGTGALVKEPTVRIDCAERTLSWQQPDGSERVAKPTPPPE